MWRDTLVCILILILVLVVMAVFGGCSDEQVAGPVGSEKAYLGNQPDPGSLVDTYILNGELDEAFPEDQQVYPYYIVRHGPEAGRYSFSEGDTVPDGAYVVLKARTTTDETALSRFNVQGQFNAGGQIHGDGIWFTFSSTYSSADLVPGWFDKYNRVASDTLGFEVGPFRYDVTMRGLLNLSDNEVYRDNSSDTLMFYGNFPPCVQCIEVGNIETDPTYQYEDPCYDQSCLEERTRLQVYSQNDPRYVADDPAVLKVLDSSQIIYIHAASGRITFEEPADPSEWKSIPGIQYTYLIYLHGKDHPREHWPETGLRVQERIKAWRYQVDYEMDADNAIADGGGVDNIDFLSGFNVAENDPEPYSNDIYIETSGDLGGAAGAWALRSTVGVPSILMHAGRDSYWGLLRAFYAASPLPPPGSPEEDILDWQAEPATQDAYTAWKLTTMQFSAGTIQAIAADESTCDWRRETNSYHYYQKTRIPDPNGRRCEDHAYDQPGITELGNIDLEDFIAYSDDRVPTVKEFDLELYPQNDAEPFTPGEDPPDWISGRSLGLSSQASRN